MSVLVNGNWSKESLYLLSSVKVSACLKKAIVREGLKNSGLIRYKTEFYDVHLFSEENDSIYVEYKSHGFEIKLEPEGLDLTSKIYHWVGDWSDFWKTLEQYKEKDEIISLERR